MKKVRKYTCLGVVTISLFAFFQTCSQKQATAEAEKETAGPALATVDYYTEADFASVKKVDVHIHIRKDDVSLIEQAQQDDFHLLNINVDSPDSPPINAQQALALKHREAFPKQIAYATTFSVQHFMEAAWQVQTLAYLKDAFAKGALAVKTWKNIGMELKDEQGRFVMIDHPKFDSLFAYMAEQNIPLLSHQGEPKNCWLPLEKMTVAGDKRYFKEHPQYHMYLHPEYPSYEEQINARDRMLAKHTNLKVVAVHLASLEWSVDELAKRLDTYPNLAVDMAARIPHLHHQAERDWQKVHDFFIKYQDRLLYGTDIVIRPNAKEAPSQVKDRVHKIWVDDWRFFTTDQKMTNSSNAQFKGLKLPRQVIDKIYLLNAQKWIPGIIKSEQ